MARKISRRKQPITWPKNVHIRHDPNLKRFRRKKNNPNPAIREISPFDAISVRPLSRGGYQAVVYSKHPHEIAHVKETIRNYRRKIPLHPNSLLAAFHESLGMPPAQKMRQHRKAITAFDSPQKKTNFSEAIRQLHQVGSPAHRSVRFALARTEFLQTLHRAIATQFPSRNAYLRAVIKLENDPVSGAIYRELNQFHQDELVASRRHIIQLIHFLEREARAARNAAKSPKPMSKP